MLKAISGAHYLFPAHWLMSVPPRRQQLDSDIKIRCHSAVLTTQLPTVARRRKADSPWHRSDPVARRVDWFPGGGGCSQQGLSSGQGVKER
jgi:hypothetical protein